MSVIDIELAMKHLRAESEDQDLVQSQLDGAEAAAMAYLNRSFFVDQAALDLAKATTLQRTQAARAVYRAALVQADAPENAEDRGRLRELARKVLEQTFEIIDMDEFGIVTNKAIEAACLLKLGHLYANREEVVTGAIATELPLTSKSLLAPYRIGMGV
ncbi:phage gp6-like head-tail connector protein [Pseudomonas sp. EKM23D]|uniref:head-tail connector protein n=1 Tax=Pseudomonas sp. EKM23D TaxID=2708062 RepID=UPI00142DEAAF|nr:head-tail connector protein [Pseudomonas sp. EKM23D]KAF6686962.1 phage gp6-like head-tail connector protein [Pseudomonas sp. EKM23D]